MENMYFFNHFIDKNNCNCNFHLIDQRKILYKQQLSLQCIEKQTKINAIFYTFNRKFNELLL